MRSIPCIGEFHFSGITLDLPVTDDLSFRSFSDDEEPRVIVQDAVMHGRSLASHPHGKEGIIVAIKAGAGLLSMAAALTKTLQS